ncbi:phospho-N-acetylmuramoyl-pentapeptide-transferase [bacterium endosymbiont of Pedicinus badii]|uniref:phospho-N-acetylmuramoyl-pentapeptide- transferase n=1 Tax=bacterium endosymbiont of Pedicinus badii TaxID=1719126 RepID=UPI0009BA5237|nr:phospho-N-acetylmuramoyl-pentapeptide-transferase [bacterium endosymbiont of Pedicinus badii]OQM34217.1 hypothetical protein AOQ89_02695 [bacterium endosymbiont of Pedicinus badii]
MNRLIILEKNIFFIKCICCIFFSFSFSYLLFYFFLKYCKNLYFSVVVKDKKLINHKKKKDIFAIGGIVIIISVLINFIFIVKKIYFKIFLIFFIFLGYGLIGLVDDFYKIMHHKKGISCTTKYILQSIVTAVFIFLFSTLEVEKYSIFFPFYKEIVVPKFLYLSLCYLIIIGSSNAVNLTDGLDGLAIFPIILTCLGFVVISILFENENFFSYKSQNLRDISFICFIVIGSGLAFLWFNSFPASIFMGDTGSLSLGSLIGVLSIFFKQEMFFFIMGIVFVIETISVILQVFFFKTVKKRIFKMSPIHHHYELSFYHESKIVTRFWILSIIGFFIAFFAALIKNYNEI